MGIARAETSSGLPIRKKAARRAVVDVVRHAAFRLVRCGTFRGGEKVFLSLRQAKPSTLEQIPRAVPYCGHRARWVVGNSLARRVSVKTSLSTRKISYCESSERRQSATSARILERGLRRWRNIIPKGRMILQPLRSRHCLSNDSTDESQHSPFTIQSL